MLGFFEAGGHAIFADTPIDFRNAGPIGFPLLVGNFAGSLDDAFADGAVFPGNDFNDEAVPELFFGEALFVGELFVGLFPFVVRI